jgi:hypothetical protein
MWMCNVKLELFLWVPVPVYNLLLFRPICGTVRVYKDRGSNALAQCSHIFSFSVLQSVVDPNPKKKFGLRFGFGFRHLCKIKKLEKSQIKHLEEKKLTRFSDGKLFSLSYRYRFQNTYETNEKHHLKKISDQNISIEIWIRNRIRIRKNEFGSTILVLQLHYLQHTTAYFYEFHY